MQQLTATHKKAINSYYKELSAYHEKKVIHETAVRDAFKNLLSAFAQSASWVLILEQTLPNGKRPDGTMRDTFNLPRGYWEAKDTKDDLQTEIRKKISIGYPTTNTIFEDTRKAVLYQDNKLKLEADLTNPKELTVILDFFFHYAAPDIATFEHAVEEFKENIPDLAQGLLKIIKEEHTKNRNFVTVFSSFLDQCRTSLDPNMSQETVDEMLVQHLLTERLFRTIFDNQDFTNRNVIASEIEKVIQALTSRSFNRKEFLKTLDRFYIAIENAARNLDDWSEKQHFLNTVYERFFQGFSIKQADTHGIVYTPQEIVDFMAASVDVILKRDFGSSLSTPGVQILDPCVGTGNFIVNLIQKHISGGSLAYKYEHDLFCNELMLLPYYIASLNIEHAYYERMGHYQPFEGIAFADTLELAEDRQLALFVEKNTERVEREKNAQIMVVIGNPPYNVGQKSDNDNNKNRTYEVIDQHIRETYVKDSTGRLHNKPYDPYVRFFRWAIDRLGTRDGIVCLVTNNSFIEQAGFEGIRKHFLQDFTQFYHLDLHGNIRKNPALSGTTHNVFGIKVGVGITIAIRLSHNHSGAKVYYHRTPEFWTKKEKLLYLSDKKDLTGIEWQELQPDERHTWFTDKLRPEFTTFLPLGLKELQTKLIIKTPPIFSAYSLGVSTNRDDFAYDFNKSLLLTKMNRLVDFYNSEVDRWRRRGNDKTTVDNFVLYNDKLIKWSGDLKIQLTHSKYASYSVACVKKSLYRPFTKRYLYFDSLLNNSIYLQHLLFPNGNDIEENVVICLTGLGAEKPFMVLATNFTPDMHLVGAGANTQTFPYYIYSDDGNNRRDNITDWALAEFQTKYSASISKWDIFHYVYAMLHHPQYRERYVENLKRDLPRIPLLANQEAFATCVRIGKQLMELHLHYEEAQEYPLNWLENKDVPISWYVEKMRLIPDKSALKINDWLTLADIPQVCYQYRLGNRSALEWVIDQYQVSTDIRSGIISDPNRDDDEQYIVRLVGRVITVSVETVKFVEELALAITQEDWMS